MELVKMAVGPAKGGLEDVVELGEVEFEGKFEDAADLGFNADDVDIGDNDEIVWIEGVSHALDHAVASRRQQWLRQSIFRGAAVITARRLNMSRQSGDNFP